MIVDLSQMSIKDILRDPRLTDDHKALMFILRKYDGSISTKSTAHNLGISVEHLRELLEDLRCFGLIPKGLLEKQ